jgi:hypothetical protein
MDKKKLIKDWEETYPIVKNIVVNLFNMNYLKYSARILILISYYNNSTIHTLECSRGCELLWETVTLIRNEYYSHKNKQQNLFLFHIFCNKIIIFQKSSTR